MFVNEYHEEESLQERRERLYGHNYLPEMAATYAKVDFPLAKAFVEWAALPASAFRYDTNTDLLSSEGLYDGTETEDEMLLRRTFLNMASEWLDREGIRKLRKTA